MLPGSPQRPRAPSLVCLCALRFTGATCMLRGGEATELWSQASQGRLQRTLSYVCSRPSCLVWGWEHNLDTLQGPAQPCQCTCPHPATHPPHTLAKDCWSAPSLLHGAWEGLSSHWLLAQRGLCAGLWVSPTPHCTVIGVQGAQVSPHSFQLICPFHLTMVAVTSLLSSGLLF